MPVLHHIKSICYFFDRAHFTSLCDNALRWWRLHIYVISTDVHVACFVWCDVSRLKQWKILPEMRFSLINYLLSASTVLVKIISHTRQNRALKCCTTEGGTPEKNLLRPCHESPFVMVFVAYWESFSYTQKCFWPDFCIVHYSWNRWNFL